MADFISRLVGRVMGLEPVVHPLVAPMFAPEPTSRPDHSPDPGRDSEDATSPVQSTRRRIPSAEEPPPARDASRERAAETAPAGQGDQRHSPPAEPGRTSRRTPEAQPRPHHPAKAGSAERRITPTEQDGWGIPPDKAKRSQGAPEAQTETSHPAGSSPTRRDEAVSTVPRVSNGYLSSGSPVTEDAPVQATPRLVGTRAERDRRDRIAPRPTSPGTEDPPVAHSGILETAKAAPDHSAPPDGPSPLAPRMIRPQADAPTQTGPQEPRVATPEPPAPTIRVSVGRVEVRAITPPPAQRETPTQTSPTLSLDDYLRQHKGGQR